MRKPWENGRFHKWGDPQTWMVYTGQLLGNLHMGLIGISSTIYQNILWENIWNIMEIYEVEI